MKHEDRQLTRELKALGYVYEGTGKHRRFRHMKTGALLIVAHSMGQGRAYKNAIATARRLARESAKVNT